MKLEFVVFLFCCFKEFLCFCSIFFFLNLSFRSIQSRLGVYTASRDPNLLPAAPFARNVIANCPHHTVFSVLRTRQNHTLQSLFFLQGSSYCLILASPQLTEYTRSDCSPVRTHGPSRFVWLRSGEFPLKKSSLKPLLSHIKTAQNLLSFYHCFI